MAFLILGSASATSAGESSAAPRLGAGSAAAKPASGRSASVPWTDAWSRGGSLTGRVLVSLRAPTRGRAHVAAVDAVIARSGARPHGPDVAQIGLLTLAPDPGVSTGRLLRKLRADPGVRAATLERRFSFRDTPDDPALSSPETAAGTPTGTPVQWWVAREGLPHAWDVTHGTDARVAVIDSGVDAAHPEFAGRIDELADYDSAAGDGPAGTDQVGHGTHVAGLACAAGGNAVGLAGAGYGCHLLVEKSDLTEASVVQAIVDATDHGAEAINMSFGTDGSSPPPQALIDAVSYADRHNVVLVAAAADSPVQEQGDPANVLQPPGSAPDITQGRGLSVTSANFAGQRSSFAGSGTEISMAAYGSFSDGPGHGGPPGIFSTFPSGPTSIEHGSLSALVAPCMNCRTSFAGDNRYAYLSGTSMAAPQVAAAAALVRHLNPDLSSSEVIRMLKETASRPPGTGWSADLGWGIVNTGAAVDRARVVDRRAPVSRLSAVRSTRRSTVTLHFRAADPAPVGLIPSGVDHLEIYRTVNGGHPLRIAVVAAARSTLAVRVAPGRRYGWWSVAVDRAGNREARSAPQALTRIARRAHRRVVRRAAHRSRRSHRAARAKSASA